MASRVACALWVFALGVACACGLIFRLVCGFWGVGCVLVWVGSGFAPCVAFKWLCGFGAWCSWCVALMPCEEMRGRLARSGSLGEWRERSTRGEGREDRRRGRGVPTRIERTRGFWGCYLTLPN